MVGPDAVLALFVAAGRALHQDWLASPPHRWLTSLPAPHGFAAQPRDLRPPDLENARRILAGGFVFAGVTLAVGPGGDPWDRPSPDRRFALALHRFAWLRDLAAQGEQGAADGLRLVLDWRRVFGRWNAFSWSPEALERRVFNLACAAKRICARASEAEAALIATLLARQARHLLDVGGGPARAAERAAAAAVAGAALGGPAGDRLLARALRRLEPALAASVAEDGGHASRSPQAALELLFDLQTLDEALTHRSQAAPEAVQRAIDRLAGAVRFFTLADGRLPAFQGGEPLTAAYVAAARAEELGERVPKGLGGYQRLDSPRLQVMVDAAAPAAGPWSQAACAQPLAMEALAGGHRLVTGVAWSPDAQGPQALRLADAASTATLGEAPCGEPLGGFAAEALGPRLTGACRVQADRQEADGAVLVELSHDGWAARSGLVHHRRLYLDTATGELRGEDRFAPARPVSGAAGRRFIPFVVRFHLAPGVSALVSRDRRSVLLKLGDDEAGWQLRNDALDAAIEPSLHHEDGQPRRTQQIVLRGQARADSGARIRWKLAPAPALPADTAMAPAYEIGSLLDSR